METEQDEVSRSSWSEDMQKYKINWKKVEKAITRKQESSEEGKTAA